MDKYFDILRECSLFNEIKDEDLVKLLGCLGARVQKFGKKYTIVQEGVPARHIGIVLSGSVQSVRIDYFGNRCIVSDAGVSDLFGEAFACAQVSSVPVTVVAAEPCEIMMIECSRIMHPCPNVCGFHQQMIFNLMKELATKNVMFHQKIEVTSKRSTREKLMAYLAMQSEKSKSSSFTIPFNRQELADYLGVERSGLSAEISKLRKEGVIESEKKRFTLL